MKMEFSKLGMALSLLAGFAAVATAQRGRAQAAPANNNAAVGSVQKLDKVVVTGSFIPQSEAVTANPVVSLDSLQFDMSGAVDSLDFFRKQTPYFFGNANIGKEANNTSDGAAGSSYGESQLALRNLTTLVLLDGRRLVGSPVSSGTVVDLNTIPNAMIDHIEILKDGASTLYGSDAIGGVVNVITKKNYNGFELSLKQGFTGNHDYKTEEYSVLGGSAREGNSLIVSIDYFRNSPVITSNRHIAALSALELAALGRAGSPAYFSSRAPGYVDGNLLAGSPLVQGTPGYNAAVVSPPIKTNPNAPAVSLDSLIANGTYIPIANTAASKALGGTTAILNTTEFGSYSIDPTSRRQFMANYDRDIVGKQVQFFADFMYTTVQNSGASLAPGPSGPGTIEINNMIIPANNPYNFFSREISTFPGGFNGGIRGRFVDVGNRLIDNTSDTYRAIAGFRGEINEDWSWELGINFSHANYKLLQRNAINGYAFNESQKPLLTAAGAYTYDSNGKPLSMLTNAAGENLPIYNYFGLPGSNDPRTIDRIRATLFQAGATDLKSIDFLVRGGLFDIPGGKVSFALGADYRGESLVANVDTLYASGYIMGGLNPIDDFAGGRTNTKSIFAEVHVPIVGSAHPVPGAYSLDLDVSGRHERLSSGSRSNVPKLGVRWSPFNRDLTLRATFAKGFAAPSIFDLFGPAQSNAPVVTLPDPTSGKLTSVQITSKELSNPNLAPSRAKAWTGGIVWSPAQIRGFDFTLDYYYIQQDGVGEIDYQTIVNDLNAKGSGSFYAALYRTSTGDKLTSTAPNQVNPVTVGQATVMKNPSGEQKTAGFDVAASYRFSLPSDKGTLKLSALANFLEYFKFKANAGAPFNDYGGYYTNAAFALGAPQNTLPDYNIKANALYTMGGFAAMLSVNYIPTVVDPGDLFGDQSTTNSFTSSGQAYDIPSYTTADLRLGYNFATARTGLLRFTNQLSVGVGVNNLFNKKPPFIPSAAEDNTDKSSYDMIGRFYSFDITKRF